MCVRKNDARPGRGLFCGNLKKIRVIEFHSLAEVFKHKTHNRVTARRLFQSPRQHGCRSSPSALRGEYVQPSNIMRGEKRIGIDYSRGVF